MSSLLKIHLNRSLSLVIQVQASVLVEELCPMLPCEIIFHIVPFLSLTTYSLMFGWVFCECPICVHDDNTIIEIIMICLT